VYAFQACNSVADPYVISNEYVSRVINTLPLVVNDGMAVSRSHANIARKHTVTSNVNSGALDGGQVCLASYEGAVANHEMIVIILYPKFSILEENSLSNLDPIIAPAYIDMTVY
jgi:hypothetical protein